VTDKYEQAAHFTQRPTCFSACYSRNWRKITC